jgi:drug/metabolite transporter (DMT)-like permease
MFIGESGCWIVVGLMTLYRKYFGNQTPGENGYRPVNTNDGTENDEGEGAESSAAANKGDGYGVLSGFRVLLLALPAICDICGTTLMNVGLLMVAASIYQMTRGALVLFVGLFSVTFLRRRLHAFQWVSLVGVVLGVAIVGLAGAIQPDRKAAPASIAAGEPSAEDPALPDAARVIIGVLLIAGAQIFTATQFVLEEWILECSTIEPIAVVGWEGLFGLAVTLIGMLVLHLAIGRTDSGRYGMFDMVEGFRQMTEYKAVLVSSFMIMISIGYVLPSMLASNQTKRNCKLHDTNTYTAVSTSLVFPLRAAFLPRLALQLTLAVRSSSGSSPSVLAGRRSSGCRLSDSPCWSTLPSSSTALSTHPSSSSKLTNLRSRSCCPKSLLNTTRQLSAQMRR